MSRTKSIDAQLAALHDKTDRQHNELDKRLDNIEKVLIAQEMNLKEHMRRTDTLEAILETVRETSATELKPLQKHVTMVEGVFKFLGLVALLLSIVSGVGKLLGII